MSKALFSLGQVVATPGALELLEQTGVNSYELLQRHVTGDWAEMDAFDQEANLESARCGTRILSAYQIGGSKIWLITEADRSSTCFLLPSEY